MCGFEKFNEDGSAKSGETVPGKITSMTREGLRALSHEISDAIANVLKSKGYDVHFGAVEGKDNILVAGGHCTMDDSTGILIAGIPFINPASSEETKEATIYKTVDMMQMTSETAMPDKDADPHKHLRSLLDKLRSGLSTDS